MAVLDAWADAAALETGADAAALGTAAEGLGLAPPEQAATASTATNMKTGILGFCIRCVLRAIDSGDEMTGARHGPGI